MSLLHEAEQTETVLVSSATRSLLNGPSFNAGTCFQTQNFRLQALLLLELGSHVRRKGDKPVCSSTCLTVEKFCCGVFSEVRSAPLIQFLPLAITPSLCSPPPPCPSHRTVYCVAWLRCAPPGTPS